MCSQLKAAKIRNLRDRRVGGRWTDGIFVFDCIVFEFYGSSATLPIALAFLP